MKGHRRTSLFPTSCTCVGIPSHQNPVFLASTSAIYCTSYLLPAAGCENAGSARLGSLTLYKSGILTAHLPGLQTDPGKWEIGNRGGQSVVNPYPACGDCVCLCVTGSRFRFRPLSPTVRQMLPLAPETDAGSDLLHPHSNQPHTLTLKHFLFCFPCVATFHLLWELCQTLLSGLMTYWTAPHWGDCEGAEPSELQSHRNPHKKQSELRHTEPLSDLTGIPLLWARNEEQAFRNKIKRSWLLNRRRWLFQVWCRRETGKEMGVKLKSKGAGISNRSKWKETERGEVCYFFCLMLLSSPSHITKME